MKRGHVPTKKLRALYGSPVGLAVWFSTIAAACQALPLATSSQGGNSLGSFPAGQAYEVLRDCDDGTEHCGIWFGSGYLLPVDVIGRDWTGPFVSAFRFDVSGLNQGQAVRYARLKVASQGGWLASRANLVIRGVLEASPDPPSQQRLPSELPKTAAGVEWNVELAWHCAGSSLGLYYSSPNIACLINEILAMSDWGSGEGGKTIMLTIEDNGSAPWGLNYLLLEDYSTSASLLDPARLEVYPTVSHAFVGKPILGKATDHSVAIGMLNLLSVESYVEYGPGEDMFQHATQPIVSQGAVPVEHLVGGLVADSAYFYRIRYREPGDSEYLASPTGSFHTQRCPGSGFVFTIQSDSHVLDACTDPAKYDRRMRLYAAALSGVAADCPDFHIEMGDFAGIEHNSGCAATGQEALARYLRQRECLADVGRSIPFYLVLGNHEGEQGWRGVNVSDSLEVWGAVARKATILNPVPDSFYSGSPDSIPSYGGRANYFAWEWGDALFVVLDVFWYTTTKPHCYFDDDYPYSNDEWDWTLGREQYEWLYSTLHASNAKWKFVFAHHLEGGVRSGSLQTPYGRGGIEAAKYSVTGNGSFEWGGEGSRGIYRFSERRPGWDHGPIHDMMVNEGVTIFFHGHDHVFMHQILDNVIYQTCPQPGDDAYTDGFWSESRYCNGVKQCNSGYLRVTVGPDQVRVDYVRAVLPEDEPIQRDGLSIWNRDVTYWYTTDAAGVTPGDIGGTRPHIISVGPNPFSTTASICFGLPSQDRVWIGIFDVRGRLVDTLLDGVVGEGVHSVCWDRRARDGDVSPGVYLCRMETGGHRHTRKLVLAR